MLPRQHEPRRAVSSSVNFTQPATKPSTSSKLNYQSVCTGVVTPRLKLVLERVLRVAAAMLQPTLLTDDNNLTECVPIISKTHQNTIY